jgi:hypothetical protein
MLKRFGMEHCNTVSTPAAVSVKLIKNDGSKPADQTLYQSIVGSLLYAASAARADISRSVGVLSKFNTAPTETHLTAAKRVLRYLKGTADYGIVYACSPEPPALYSDASWADDSENCHSTSGIICIQSQGPISWSSKQQSVVALSTAEAEYIAASEAMREACWLRQLLSALNSTWSKLPISLHVDNQSAIALANVTSKCSTKTNTKRTKRVDIRYHYIREEIANEHIVTHYCPSKDMKADILTKAIPLRRFAHLQDAINIKAQ